MKTNYSEQLKSPKWQKKRLEILQRDGFKCALCMNEDEQLNVHHKKYITGRKVWEYENEFLISLCNSCHEKVHKKEKSTELEALLDLLKRYDGKGIDIIEELAFVFNNTENSDIIVSLIIGMNKLDAQIVNAHCRIMDKKRVNKS